MQTLTYENIQKYIGSKMYSWSPTTIKSERAKLAKVASLLGEATNLSEVATEAIYEALKANYSPYSLKQVMIRLGEVEAFLNNTTKIKSWIKANSRLFRGVYERKAVSTSFEDAATALEAMPESKAKALAKWILNTGARSTEALNFDSETNTVMGKGERIRHVLVMDTKLKYPEAHGLTYIQFYRELKAHTGLTPHALRKLFATRLANSGASVQDLLYLLGWTNIQTASLYLQPRKEEALRELFNKHG